MSVIVQHLPLALYSVPDSDARPWRNRVLAVRMASDSRAAPKSLRWQIEAGADEAIGDVAARPLCATLRWHSLPGADVAIADRRATAAAPQPAPTRAAAAMQPARRRRRAAPRPDRRRRRWSPPRQAGETARSLAAAAKTLAELRAAVAGFDGCALKLTANQPGVRRRQSRRRG